MTFSKLILSVAALLTTLIIKDLVLVPGSGAGGHTTLGWVTGVYLSTVAGWRLQSLTSRQWIKYDLRCKVHSKTFISYCHLILELLVIGKGQTFLNYKEQIEQLK